MVLIPESTRTTAHRIYKLHEERREQARDYLGASEVGEPCLRRLWMRWRWCEHDEIEGRILRLFDTGEREEERVLAELEALGYTVAERQFEVVFAHGHGKGHIDAGVLGLEEAPKTWHVVDVKTAKAKKFDEILKKGVDAVYPKYIAQVQIYMGLTGMERAALIFVCKDDDRLHMERFHFERGEFDRLMKKAQSIVESPEPPPRISDDPAWFECRYCEMRELCHGTVAPLPNCRTCANATPLDEGVTGSWYCEKNETAIDTAFQRLGCEDHVYIPKLIERIAELVGVAVTDDGNVVTWRNQLTGKTFKQPDYLSREIRAALDKRLLGEEGVDRFKAVFGPARIIGPLPPEGEEALAWQTFKNGIRHVRRTVNGAFAGYVQQTPEVLAKLEAAGNPQFVADFEDDIPWEIGGDESNGTVRGAGGAAQRTGAVRRRTDELPFMQTLGRGKPVHKV
jgi:hypothetical protein